MYIKKHCTICSKTQHKGIRDKFRISEDARAEHFLKAVTTLQDEVFVRVADCDSNSRVFGADLYYHKVCLESYLRKFERSLLSSTQTRKGLLKRNIFQEETDCIQQTLDRGFGVTLSEIRDAINEKNEEDIISNKEVKLFLSERFGDQIQFVKSDRQYEPMMVFSSHIKIEDVMTKLRSINTIKEAAELIKTSLKSTDFGLEDKFCDSEELTNAWVKSEPPACLINFFLLYLIFLSQH